MKKLVLLVISVITLLSCNDDFITKEPLGVSSNLTFYDTPENCELAVNAVYDPLQWESMYSRNFWGVADVCSDDAEKGGSDLLASYESDQSEMHALCTYNANPLNEYLGSMWSGYYIGISRANSLISQTKESILTKDSVIFKRLRAEARFLRAFFYFDLVRVWGPVPLISENVSIEDSKNIGNRAEGDDAVGTKQMRKIYDFIISELDAIQNDLPWGYSSENAGRVTASAAKALLAKVYLYRADVFDVSEDYENAFTVANNLIQNPNNLNDLETYYQDAFDMNLDNQNSIEYVFAIQFISNSSSKDSYNREQGAEGSIKPTYTGPRWIINDKNKPMLTGAYGYGFMMPTQDLVDEFHSDDPRLTMMFKEGDSLYTNLINSAVYEKRKIYFPANKTTGYYTKKHTVYHDKFDALNPQNTGKNIPVIRFAEVLLIAAEAGVQSGHTPEALAYINDLRTRARNSARVETGFKEYDYSVAPSLEPADYSSIDIAKVRKERRMELFCESNRYFDLVRWGQADAELGAITEDIAGFPVSWNPATLGRFPIPSQQIKLQTGGNLIQNPGY